ncbi:hypothetical protein ALP86_01799, partial [Pseudomonas amygdali pv. mori]
LQTFPSRGDFAAKNARAEQAREMYATFGEIPQDILEGTQRSKFAPALATASNSPADDDREDGFDDAMTLGQPHHEQPGSESEE